MADEGPYIQEWIRWHLEQGAEHFYIYDNDRAELDYESFFSPELYPFVTVVPWKGVKKIFNITPQRRAYNHCTRNYARDCQWLAVVSAVGLGVWPVSCHPSGTSGRHPDPPLGLIGTEPRQLDTCWCTPTSDVTG